MVGAGVIGIATALELARRGRRVCAIDRLGSGHPATSSTGASRSIRVAYDHPTYVGLALEAIAAWRRLEAASGRAILHLTGQLDLGPEAKLGDLARAVRGAGAAIDELAGAELCRIVPELRVAAGEVGLFHADAGTVIADAALAALVDAAAAAGVVLLAPERVRDVVIGDHVTVATDRRHVAADGVVIAAGPWSAPLLAAVGIAVPLAPAIAQVTFLDAPALVDRPGIVEWELAGGAGTYGHPVPGLGYKVAFDAGAAGWDPDALAWAPDPDEERRLLAWLGERLPGFPQRVARTQRHPWTMTPDADFVVDRRGAVTVACGCSGHAFKFGPALGRLVADVVEGGEPPSLMRLDRPALRRAAPPPSAPITR